MLCFTHFGILNTEYPTPRKHHSLRYLTSEYIKKNFEFLSPLCAARVMSGEALGYHIKSAERCAQQPQVRATFVGFYECLWYCNW